MAGRSGAITGWAIPAGAVAVSEFMMEGFLRVEDRVRAMPVRKGIIRGSG
jgi:hypothetical protein